MIGLVLFAYWSVLTEVGLTLHGNGENRSSCRVLDLHRRQFVIIAKARGPSARRTKAIELQTLEAIVHSNATIRHAGTGESEAVLDDIPLKGHGRASTQIGPVPLPACVVERGRGSGPDSSCCAPVPAGLQGDPFPESTAAILGSASVQSALCLLQGF